MSGVNVEGDADVEGDASAENDDMSNGASEVIVVGKTNPAEEDEYWDLPEVRTYVLPPHSFSHHFFSTQHTLQPHISHCYCL